MDPFQIFITYSISYFHQITLKTIKNFQDILLWMLRTFTDILLWVGNISVGEVIMYRFTSKFIPFLTMTNIIDIHWKFFEVSISCKVILQVQNKFLLYSKFWTSWFRLEDTHLLCVNLDLVYISFWHLLLLYISITVRHEYFMPLQLWIHHFSKFKLLSTSHSVLKQQRHS